MVRNFFLHKAIIANAIDFLKLSSYPLDVGPARLFLALTIKCVLSPGGVGKGQKGQAAHHLKFSGPNEFSSKNQSVLDQLLSTNCAGVNRCR